MAIDVSKVLKKSVGDSTGDRRSKPVQKSACKFMNLRECRTVKGEPNLEMCKLCILGRIEQHLYRLSSNSERKSKKEGKREGNN